MEILNKQITNERTGSNIVGINLDTQTRYVINPSVLNSGQHEIRANLIDTNVIFQEIEKVAREAEAVKKHNEEIKLFLELEKLDLNHLEKWAEVNNKYDNDDTYTKFLNDKNDIKQAKNKLIVDNKYLSKQQKDELLQKVDLSSQKDYINTLQKRNEHFIKRQIDDLVATNKQLIEVAGASGYNKEKKEEIYHRLADNYKALQNLGHFTDSEMVLMLGRAIKEAEKIRLSNLLSDINSSDVSPWEKEKQLKVLFHAFDNKATSETLAENLLQFFDESQRKDAKEFLSTVFDAELKNIVKSHQSALREQNRLIKQQEREHKARLRAIERAARSDNERIYVSKHGELPSRESIKNGTYKVDYTKENAPPQIPKRDIIDISKRAKDLKNSGATDKEVYQFIQNASVEYGQIESNILRKSALSNLVMKEVATNMNLNPNVIKYCNDEVLGARHELAQTFKTSVRNKQKIDTSFYEKNSNYRTLVRFCGGNNFLANQMISGYIFTNTNTKDTTNTTTVNKAIKFLCKEENRDLIKLYMEEYYNAR